jgi:hypothetical protein
MKLSAWFLKITYDMYQVLKNKKLLPIVTKKGYIKLDKKTHFHLLLKIYKICNRQSKCLSKNYFISRIFIFKYPITQWSISSYQILSMPNLSIYYCWLKFVLSIIIYLLLVNICFMSTLITSRPPLSVFCLQTSGFILHWQILWKFLLSFFYNITIWIWQCCK